MSFLLLNEKLLDLAGHVGGTLWAGAEQYLSDVPQGLLFYSYVLWSAANALWTWSAMPLVPGPWIALLMSQSLDISVLSVSASSLKLCRPSWPACCLASPTPPFCHHTGLELPQCVFNNIIQALPNPQLFSWASPPPVSVHIPHCFSHL